MHDIALRDDGRCLLCRRRTPELESASPWKLIGGVVAVFALVLGGYALARDRGASPAAVAPSASAWIAQTPPGPEPVSEGVKSPKPVSRPTQQSEARANQAEIREEMKRVPIRMYVTDW